MGNVWPWCALPGWASLPQKPSTWCGYQTVHPKTLFTCHTRCLWEQRALVCPRRISRYAWMWTSVQLLCHGVMPKWLRQSGGVVRCTKQWKADGQPSSGLSQVREQSVMGAFPIVLGNGASMKIKYDRKVLRLLKDLIRRILTRIRSQYP